MGFRQADKEGRGGFARVWEVDKKDNYSLIKLNTSKKKKDGDGYDTDFQDGYVRFIGTAHKKISEVDINEKGIGIQITSCEVTNSYDKENKKIHVNYLVYDFDFTDSSKKSNGSTTAANKTKKKEVEPEPELEDDEELPF